MVNMIRLLPSEESNKLLGRSTLNVDNSDYPSDEERGFGGPVKRRGSSVDLDQLALPNLLPPNLLPPSPPMTDDEQSHHRYSLTTTVQTHNEPTFSRSCNSGTTEGSCSFKTLSTDDEAYEASSDSSTGVSFDSMARTETNDMTATTTIDHDDRGSQESLCYILLCSGGPQVTLVESDSSKSLVDDIEDDDISCD